MSVYLFENEVEEVVCQYGNCNYFKKYIRSRSQSYFSSEALNLLYVFTGHWPLWNTMGEGSLSSILIPVRLMSLPLCAKQHRNERQVHLSTQHLFSVNTPLTVAFLLHQNLSPRFHPDFYHQLHTQYPLPPLSEPHREVLPAIVSPDASSTPTQTQCTCKQPLNIRGHILQENITRALSPCLVLTTLKKLLALTKKNIELVGIQQYPDLPNANANIWSCPLIWPITFSCTVKCSVLTSGLIAPLPSRVIFFYQWIHLLYQ